jgi:Fur family transcriptional regulator, ferric uptake regulator
MAQQPREAAGGFEAELRAAGIRPTRARIAVLEELSRVQDDATAQGLHRRLAARRKRVGLATVYRALHDLSEAGLIDSLAHGGAEACYRLCSPQHHHHLFCYECHRVVELTDCRLGEWLGRAGAAAGFVVTDHTLEAVGLCASCRYRIEREGYAERRSPPSSGITAPVR